MSLRRLIMCVHIFNSLCKYLRCPPPTVIDQESSHQGRYEEAIHRLRVSLSRPKTDSRGTLLQARPMVDERETFTSSLIQTYPTKASSMEIYILVCGEVTAAVQSETML